MSLEAFKSLASTSSLRILFFVGLGLAAWLGWSWWSETELIRRARPVSAEVLAVSVDSYTVGTGTNRDRQWRPAVRFRYRVNGRGYESDRMTPLGKGGSRQWAEELVSRFHVGQQVEAWVDPEDAAAAYLLPVRSWKEPIGTCLGVALVLVSGFVLLGRKRARRTAGVD